MLIVITIVMIIVIITVQNEGPLFTWALGSALRSALATFWLLRMVPCDRVWAHVGHQAWDGRPAWWPLPCAVAAALVLLLGARCVKAASGRFGESPGEAAGGAAGQEFHREALAQGPLSDHDAAHDLAANAPPPARPCLAEAVYLYYTIFSISQYNIY